MVGLPHFAPQFGYQIVQDGGYVVFSTNFGVFVRYDGNYIISAGIPEVFKTTVEGTSLKSKNR